MDAVREWVDAQSRVIELVDGLSSSDAERMVPSCPAWTVRELLAHVIGLDADVLAGDEPDDHNSEWTQRQVDARASHDVPRLVAEWRELTQPMQDWMHANNTRPLGDVVIHEQDLRGALGRSGARDNAALATLRERFAAGFATKVAAAGLPAIRLEGDGWDFTAGESAPTVVVRASGFDLGRALIARRSAAQLRSWTASGDVTPYLDCFATLGDLPDTDLTD